jgi:hypothetical protein
VPPTGQRQKTERELHLEELREEAEQVRETLLERIAEVIVMRE